MMQAGKSRAHGRRVGTVMAQAPTWPSWAGRCSRLTVPALVALGVAASPSLPASAQTLPGAANPARIEEQFRPGPAPQSVPRAPAQVEPTAAPAGAEQVRFVLNRVVFDGVTVYSEADLQPLYQDRLGTEVSLADMYAVAQRATAKYRNDGYLLSQVLVPPQRVDGGVVHLRAVEGYVDEVTVEGEIAGPADLVQSYGNQIREARPLRADVLERYLLLSGDLAGNTARGVLTPSPSVPGASNLAIVLEHRPVEAFVSVDNRGSQFIGPLLFTSGAVLNSVLGLYERISVTLATASPMSELLYGNIAGSIPVGNEGTVAGFSFTASDSRPGFTLANLDLDSQSYSGTLSITHPVIRSREQNLTFGLSFTWLDSTTDSGLANQTLIRDRLRVLRAHGTYDFVDSLLGVNLIDIELSQGLDIFGATGRGDLLASRGVNSGGPFTKVVATLQRVQRLLPGLAFLVEVSGQYADTALLSSEQFGVGGARFGRGYDPSEITGDHGIAVRTELQYGGDIPDLPVAATYQVYGFYDAGRVWNRETVPDETALSSAGGGVRLNLSTHFSANVEVARQLDHVSNSSGDGTPESRDRETRVLFNVVARF